MEAYPYASMLPHCLYLLCSIKKIYLSALLAYHYLIGVNSRLYYGCYPVVTMCNIEYIT